MMRNDGVNPDVLGLRLDGSLVVREHACALSQEMAAAGVACSRCGVVRAEEDARVAGAWACGTCGITFCLNCTGDLMTAWTPALAAAAGGERVLVLGARGAGKTDLIRGLERAGVNVAGFVEGGGPDELQAAVHGGAADAVVLVFDVHDAAAFEAARAALLRAGADDGTQRRAWVRAVLVGTKIDDVDRVRAHDPNAGIELGVVREWRGWGVEYVEASAHTGLHVGAVAGAIVRAVEARRAHARSEVAAAHVVLAAAGEEDEDEGSVDEEAAVQRPPQPRRGIKSRMRSSEADKMGGGGGGGAGMEMKREAGGAAAVRLSSPQPESIALSVAAPVPSPMPFTPAPSGPPPPRADAARAVAPPSGPPHLRVFAPTLVAAAPGAPLRPQPPLAQAMALPPMSVPVPVPVVVPVPVSAPSQSTEAPWMADIQPPMAQKLMRKDEPLRKQQLAEAAVIELPPPVDYSAAAAGDVPERLAFDEVPSVPPPLVEEEPPGAEVERQPEEDERPLGEYIRAANKQLQIERAEQRAARRAQTARRACSVAGRLACGPCLVVWWLVKKVLERAKVDNVLADTENAFQV